MGACDIRFTLKGDASRSDVLEAFKKKQLSDAEYNGHREGYSGDFQTVHEVKFHTEFPGCPSLFPSFNDAYEYCLEKAEKWVYVVAVRYTADDGKTKWLICGWGAC